MDLRQLHNIVEEIGLPAFREKQIRQAFFVGLARDWNEVTVLNKELREKFALEIPWSTLRESKISENKADGSVKAALKLEDDNLIETVLIKHKDGRNTICVSSQVGCPMGCAFCATGKSGFKRNLEVYEIIDQVLYFARRLKKTNEKVTNIVYMGMGEPLLNYDNVIESIRVMNDKEYFNFGARHISISTCGIVPGIQKLMNEKYQVNLALSMHAPTDKQRGSFMPINKQYNLDQVLGVIDEYIEKTNRRVMIEYLLIEGVNDSEEDATKLAKLLKNRPLCLVNLIPYNETGGAYTKSSIDNVTKFAATLDKLKTKYTIRHSFGANIDAACGQLAGKK